MKMEEKEKEIKKINAISISPNYFITEINPDKFTKGTFIGNKVVFGQTFDQNLKGKIIIYEDRVKGWFLDHARSLLKEKHADFVVLMICTSFLEGYQQFKEGISSKSQSQEMIKRALGSMFQISDKQKWVLDIFVEGVRNGLFHDGMTKERISLNRDSQAPIIIKEDFGGMILINPILFFWVIEEDFKEYIDNLKNPENKELREKFEKHWNEKHPLSYSNKEQYDPELPP